jgi:hypothetical protein
VNGASKEMIMSHVDTLPAPLPGSRRIGRRVLAVVAGLLANGIPASVMDGVLHATGVYPPLGQRMSHGLFVLALAYRLVLGVAGSYLTARLAPDRPMQHSLALGGVGVLLGVAGTIALWNAGPAWYPLTLIALTMPCAWLGGRLFQPSARR